MSEAVPTPFLSSLYAQVRADQELLQLTRVHWRDSCARSSWHTAADVADFVREDYVVESVGWLAAESDTHLAIAQSVSPHRFGDVLVIPKTAVIAQWNLNE